MVGLCKIPSPVNSSKHPDPTCWWEKPAQASAHYKEGNRSLNPRKQTQVFILARDGDIKFFSVKASFVCSKKASERHLQDCNTHARKVSWANLQVMQQLVFLGVFWFVFFFNFFVLGGNGEEGGGVFVFRPVSHAPVAGMGKMALVPKRCTITLRVQKQNSEELDPIKMSCCALERSFAYTNIAAVRKAGERALSSARSDVHSAGQAALTHSRWPGGRGGAGGRYLGLSGAGHTSHTGTTATSSAGQCWRAVSEHRRVISRLPACLPAPCPRPYYVTRGCTDQRCHSTAQLVTQQGGRQMQKQTTFC